MNLLKLKKKLLRLKQTIKAKSNNHNDKDVNGEWVKVSDLTPKAKLAYLLEKRTIRTLTAALFMGYDGDQEEVIRNFTLKGFK